MLTRNPEALLEALDDEAEFKEVDPALLKALIKEARALAKKLKFKIIDGEGGGFTLIDTLGDVVLVDDQPIEGRPIDAVLEWLRAEEVTRIALDGERAKAERPILKKARALAKKLHFKVIEAEDGLWTLLDPFDDPVLKDRPADAILDALKVENEDQKRLAKAIRTRQVVCITKPWLRHPGLGPKWYELTGTQLAKMPAEHRAKILCVTARATPGMQEELVNRIAAGRIEALERSRPVWEGHPTLKRMLAEMAERDKRQQDDCLLLSKMAALSTAIAPRLTLIDGVAARDPHARLCAHCRGPISQVKRMDAKYCCPGCEKAAKSKRYRDKQKAKP
jgi:hypothetical protein